MSARTVLSRLVARHRLQSHLALYCETRTAQDWPGINGLDARLLRDIGLGEQAAESLAGPIAAYRMAGGFPSFGLGTV
jgi:hypothetical protein